MALHSGDNLLLQYIYRNCKFTFKWKTLLWLSFADHIDEIITLVYQYISLIKQLLDSRLNISLFEELELMSKLDFVNKDQSKPLDMVQQLSECLKVNYKHYWCDSKHSHGAPAVTTDVFCSLDSGEILIWHNCLTFCFSVSVVQA